MVQSSGKPLTAAVERMPVEMWQNVLLHLDYFELKVVQRVCRDWKELIESPAFDRVLFRRGKLVSHFTNQMADVRLNPAVSYLYPDPSLPTPEFELRRGRISSKLGAVGSELLTYPPTATAGFYTGFSLPDLEVMSARAGEGQGVTVADLVVQLQRTWHRIIPGSLGGSKDLEYRRRWSPHYPDMSSHRCLLNLYPDWLVVKSLPEELSKFGNGGKLGDGARGQKRT